MSKKDGIYFNKGCGYIVKSGKRTKRSEVKSEKYSDPSGEGDEIECTVDFTKATISYKKNGKDLGVAFKDVKGPLIPAVSVVATDTELVIY